MLRLKTFSVVPHIAGWLLFMTFPLLFLNGRDSNSTGLFVLLASPYYWLFCITYIVLFYFNANSLIPRFFINKKYIGYSIICLCLLSAVYFLKPFDHLLQKSENRGGYDPQQGPPQPGPPPMEDAPLKQYRPPGQNGKLATPENRTPEQFNGPPPGGGRRIDTTSLFIFLMIMALSTATKTVQQWQATERRATMAEAGKASAELSFLKAQINPHFLFNTLNNIYSLAVTGNAHTAESIMKLSNIMRYITDEGTADEVSLQNEADYITDYIDLQRLRLGDKTTVHLNITGDIARHKIAPLLLMAFVENIFKYGISKHDASDVLIDLSASHNVITFSCQNRIFERENNPNRAGIGIINTRKRLAYLYKGRYLLHIDNTGNLFRVNLTLQC